MRNSLLIFLKAKRTNGREQRTEYVLTVDNARPLDQALQHATEMVRWLQDGFGLDTQTTHICWGNALNMRWKTFSAPLTIVC